MKKGYLSCLFIFFSFFSFSQIFEGIKLDNETYTSGIHSIKLCLEGQSLGHPVIRLNSDDRLHLSFDDLETDSRFLKYTLIHCTHDWQVSSMNQMEYLSGFMEDELSGYTYSFNTIQHYMHYELTFPTDYMQVTKSGNYILFVYDDNPDNPILTRKMMIVESVQAGISGKVHAATDVNYMYSKQEIDVILKNGPYEIRNPALYLNLSIVQNGRWDNAIIGLKYRSAFPGEYSFDYDNNENVMNGGGEFRTFDTRSLLYNGDRIVSIGYKEKENQAWVLEDKMRTYNAYESNTTLKGSCFYKTSDYSGENREDYVRVHFSLRPDYEISDGDLYIFGELTDWKIQEEAKLTFNPVINYWETSLYLKQGYYNYQYVYVRKGDNTIDETYIEGNHWQTENDYMILAYLRDEGNVYDRLIGVAYLNIAQ